VIHSKVCSPDGAQRNPGIGAAAKYFSRIPLRDGQDARVPRSAWMRESGLHAGYVLPYTVIPAAAGIQLLKKHRPTGRFWKVFDTPDPYREDSVMPAQGI
jgi:hypothetical protein